MSMHNLTIQQISLYFLSVFVSVFSRVIFFPKPEVITKKISLPFHTKGKHCHFPDEHSALCPSSKLPSSYYYFYMLVPPMLVWCSVIIILHFQDKHTFYIHHWVHYLQCLLILLLHHQQIVISVPQSRCML